MLTTLCKRFETGCSGLLATLLPITVLLTVGPASARAAEPAAATTPDGGVIEVEAEGEGLDKEGATKDALRKALEKGGKNEIFSETKVENFQLMHDTIISRAEGIVTDYKILPGYPKKIVGGTVKVKIKARVSKKILKDHWGAVQNVLKQIGRPKIMIYIVEKIDGQEEKQGLLETQIEKRLLKAGFDLVARTAIEAALAKEKGDATAENDARKLQALAKSFKAHLYITGTANANQAGMAEAAGLTFAAYNCDVQLKAYYTDSAKLLASANLPVQRGLARGKKEFSPQAGKQALGFAGTNVVEDVYTQIMKQWATQISAGGELILEVEGIKPVAAVKMKKALKALKGVEDVNFDLSKGRASFRIRAKLSAETLLEHLVDEPFDKLIEVVDLKLNRVQAKGIGA